MKEYQLRHSLGRTIAFSFCLWASVAGFFSCDSDRLNGGGSIGMLSLNLAADTANIKGGTLSTKAGNVLEDFEDVDGYRVQIFQESDTLTSVLYKDFPQEMEIKEGSYTLRASKGEILPAAFDNPYFEGSTDFVIKKDMKTPLEVTCTMANARVYAEYSEDFLKAYSDYSVSLKTSYMDDVFTVAKGETRGAYLQVAKEGTPLSIAISLMRENWDEAKVYTVTNPSITLNPKESVTLKFATDGKTGDGLDLSIVLDDEMIETELVDSIPDFMWKPFEKPTLEAHGFTSGQTMQITKGGVKEAYIAFGVPAGIGGFSVYETVKGSTDTVKYELTVEGNVSELKKKGYDISVPTKSLLNYSGNGQLLLEKMLNQLECSETDKPYEFIFFAKDNLPNTNYTDTVRLFAEIYPAAPIVEFEGEFGSVVEGEAMKHDVIASIEAEGKIKDVVVTISTSTEEKEYHYSIASEWEQLGCALSKADDDTKATLTFPKTFTEGLDALDDGDQIYTIAVKVETEVGLEGNTLVEVSQPLAIKMPVFDWAMANNEGDVFAKRAILRTRVSVGNSDKIKYEYSYGVLSDNRVKENGIVIDTLRGLEAITSYTVQLVYDNGRSRRKEISFTTEDFGVLPNSGFENWSNNGDAATNTIWAAGSTKSPYRYWEIWYPWSNESNQGWNTINLKTTQDGGTKKGWVTALSTPYVWTRYVANSGTIRTTDKVNGSYAALVRSVGWGSGSTASGNQSIQKQADPGYLYLGSYNNETKSGDYGISFRSRPSGFRFYCKYSSKSGEDAFIAKMVVLDGNDNIIAEGEIPKSESGTISNYEQKTVWLNYKQNSAKAEKMYILFQSGTRLDKNDWNHTSEDFNCPQATNLSNGEFVGSQLYIDDVELIYE
ncbi:DUF4493 domain-containing protein [uncultured Parabacteroides sp.]|uniref:DUF4493 domain-containing protein n=1 Tax=uncultured Parabacteroides sp. TaxID=512312 RepID=UPI00280492C0|nr:DUF4493 domain-containing protein [uncultured Parabacteroides sp.]